MPTISLNLTIDFTYTITYKGHPGVTPSISHPGDPPEPPEFNIDEIALYATTLSPARLPNGALGTKITNSQGSVVSPRSMEDMVYCLLLEAAEGAVLEDIWERQHDREDREPDYPDPPF